METHGDNNLSVQIRYAAGAVTLNAPQGQELPMPKPKINSQVFISYRREPFLGFVSRLYGDLKKYVEEVFYDKDLRIGEWNDALLVKIYACKVFLLVVAPTTFDRCVDPQDVVRQEIVEARNSGKAILPLFEDAKPDWSTFVALPPPLTFLPRLQSISIFYDDWESGVGRLLTYL